MAKCSAPTTRSLTKYEVIALLYLKDDCTCTGCFFNSFIFSIKKEAMQWLNITYPPKYSSFPSRWSYVATSSTECKTRRTWRGLSLPLTSLTFLTEGWTGFNNLNNDLLYEYPHCPWLLTKIDCSSETLGKNAMYSS